MVQEQAATTRRNLPPIKRDPRLTNGIKMRNIGFWLLGFWCVLFAIDVIVKHTSHVEVFYMPYLLVNPNVLFLCGIMLPINAFFQMRSYKKIEQKRQAVAHGEQVLLADQQPVPNSSTPVLPLVMGYQIYWPIMLAILGFFALIIILIFIINIWVNFSQVQITVILFDCAVFIALFVYAVILQGNRQLILDETGLSMKTILSPKVRHIPWDKARFFAIDALPYDGRINNKLPLTFELASEQEVIQWLGNRRNIGREDRLIRPVGTPEQYEQQLHAVNTLIVEKTGLPLYDLRR